MKNKKLVSYFLFSVFIVAIAVCAILLTNTFVSVMAVAKPNNVIIKETETINIKSNLLETTTGGEEKPQFPDLSTGITIPQGEVGIKDSYLYVNLLSMFNRAHLNDEGYVEQTYLNSVMFKELTELKLFNLSVTSIKGLNKLDFRNVKTLNLSCNELAVIESADLSSFTSLTKINLFDNELTSIDLSKCYLLTDINLTNNKLSNINLKSQNICNVNLNFNRFTSVKNIIFPEVVYNTNLKVELINNNILDADEMFLDVENVYQNKIKLTLGVQGVGLNIKSNATDEEKEKFSTVNKTTAIKFYGFGDYNVKAVIRNRISGELIKEFINDDTNPLQTLNLNVGTYKLEYLKIEDESFAYVPTDDVMGAFKPTDRFDVVPSTATAKFKIAGKLYDTYGKISGKAQLVLTNPNDSGEIWYKVANGDWTQGITVNLTHGGEYVVSYKIIDGDFESATNSTFIYSNMNMYISDIFLIIIIISVGLILFFVGLPLIKKYLMKR